jgi:uncharacterized protein
VTLGSGARSSDSFLYEGTIRHWRRGPAREFQHRIAMVYIDLAELPALLGGRLVREIPGVVRFRRSDYHGEADVPLTCAVRDTVAKRTGRRPIGPIRLLTTLRSYGLCFNPVSFYYCFDETDTRVEAVLAEVTNTPWGERHAYVMQGEVGQFEKALHVSPFMAMDHVYRCQAPAPGAELRVVIENHHDEEKLFEAALVMQRRELTSASLRRLSLRYPFSTFRTLALIYGHAVGLRLAGLHPFPHPPRHPA